MSDLSNTDLQGRPVTEVWVEPFDGWGFMETIDGHLAPAFQAYIEAAGVDTGDGVKGWRGSVASEAHKYRGMPLTMRPRHTHWSGMVVAEVGPADEIAYSGLAVTTGLRCDWL